MVLPEILYGEAKSKKETLNSDSILPSFILIEKLYFMIYADTIVYGFKMLVLNLIVNTLLLRYM